MGTISLWAARPFSCQHPPSRTRKAEFGADYVSKRWPREKLSTATSRAPFQLTPFSFESETTGLTFVRHRWPQSLRWQLFSWFPREDQAADYKCGHSQSKAHKLQWVHVVCPSPDTTEQYGSPLILAIFCKSSGSVAMFTAIRHASS